MWLDRGWVLSFVAASPLLRLPYLIELVDLTTFDISHTNSSISASALYQGLVNFVSNDGIYIKSTYIASASFH